MDIFIERLGQDQAIEIIKGHKTNYRFKLKNYSLFEKQEKQVQAKATLQKADATKKKLRKG